MWHVQKEHAALTEKSHQARGKKNILALFGILAAGGGMFLLLPVGGALAGLAVIVGAAAGGAAGWSLGDGLWMRPVQQEFQHFKDESTQTVLRMRAVGKMLENEGTKERKQLSAQIEQMTAKYPVRSHVEALELRQPRSMTVLRG